MGMSLALRNNTITALGTGAVSIVTIMVPGKAGLEGREHYLYEDVVGVVTVCDRHTGNDIVWGKYYSGKGCGALTRKDVTHIAVQVDPHIKVQTTEMQRAAIYNSAYNVGITATINSTLLKKPNAKDHAGAYSKLKRWVYADGKKWKGLMNRRDIEHEVCTRNKK